MVAVKVLLADPHRDLLKAYSRLLALEGHEVTVCFEGAEAVKRLATERCDMAFAYHALPHVACAELTQLAQERAIPLAVLLDEPPGTGMLLARPLPEAYLAYPFLPQEFLRLLYGVTEKKAAKEPLVYGDLCVDVAGFSIRGTDLRLTNAELDVLIALGQGAPFPQKRTACVNALNCKFIRAGLKTRIVYEQKEGFRLVNAYEKS